MTPEDRKELRRCGVCLEETLLGNGELSGDAREEAKEHALTILAVIGDECRLQRSGFVYKLEIFRAEHQEGDSQR